MLLTKVSVFSFEVKTTQLTFKLPTSTKTILTLTR